MYLLARKMLSGVSEAGEEESLFLAGLCDWISPEILMKEIRALLINLESDWLWGDE